MHFYVLQILTNVNLRFFEMMCQNIVVMIIIIKANIYSARSLNAANALQSQLYTLAHLCGEVISVV